MFMIFPLDDLTEENYFYFQSTNGVAATPSARGTHWSFELSRGVQPNDVLCSFLVSNADQSDQITGTISSANERVLLLLRAEFKDKQDYNPRYPSGVREFVLTGLEEVRKALKIIQEIKEIPAEYLAKIDLMLESAAPALNYPPRRR